jgi:hypothetical protein
LLLTGVATFAQTVDPDKAAVRQVLENETQPYLSANPTLMLAQWSDKPYVERQHASLVPLLKAPYLKGPTLKPITEGYMKTLKPSTHTRRIADYESHVSGNMAWVTYTQEDLNEAGVVVGKERSLRILEREPAG